jgi:uncharacterized protein
VHDPTLQTLLILLCAVGAGFLGALTGLGGGVVIVPALVLLFGVDLRLAIPASLLAVIATSSGSAAAYVRDGYTNVRLGTLLEVATVAGAILGASIAAMVSKEAITIVFVLALFYAAWGVLRPPTPKPASTPSAAPPHPTPTLADRLAVHSSFPSTVGVMHYRVERLGAGLLVMLAAGVLSALVGIGGGILKVLAMDRLMHLPFKVSTTTSNFMLGVTAAASVGIYFQRGQVELMVAGPAALGALMGAIAGARVLPRVKTLWLRRIFAGVVILSGVEMLRRLAMQGGGWGSP